MVTVQALILAAGRGSRLGQLTLDKPKSLLRVGDTTIIEHQIELLHTIGIRPKQIFVVGGYKFETLQYLSAKGINLIYNPKYREYNNIYSFYLAQKHICEDFLLLNGDTIVHPNILDDLVSKTSDGTFFVIDNVKKLGEEEMKVIIKNGRIVRFGKDIPPHISHGEYIGVAKFSFEDAKVIFDVVEKVIKEGQTGIWYELGINHALDDVCVQPHYTHGLPWIEVDTPEDYAEAKKVFALIKNEAIWGADE